MLRHLRFDRRSLRLPAGPGLGLIVRLALLALLLLGRAVAPAAAQETEVRFLSGTGPEDAVPWDFLCTGGRNSGVWTTIPVPSCWELQGFGTYNYGRSEDGKSPVDFAREEGRYRKTFRLPPEWRDRRVRVVFEGSMTDTTVRINGRSAGPTHQGSFYRFHYDITDLVRFDAENLLEVDVAKMSANESVNRAERQADYWVFGGIFRPVWLEARPAEAIEWTAIDARADGSFAGFVHFSTPLAAPAEVRAEIVDAAGRAVGAGLSAAVPAGATVAELRGAFPGVALWSAETPNLHRVRFTLSRAGAPLHAVGERFGFRTFEVRPGDGLYLNGRKILLKGANRHCFWPETGRTVSRARSYADARLMKEMNMNAARMAHYPPDRHFLEACDELGLYVLDELGGWQKAYDTPTGARLIGQMIRRDVNHPSILFWDNGNEGGWNTANDGEFARWDPQRRPVLHPWEKHDGVDTNHYETYDSHRALTRGPMLYMPTEFLHALYDGGAGAGLRDYWDAVLDGPVAAGGFIWALVDEGVVRTDLGGRIDSATNRGPDGIVGPHREKEGSFFTIREIWSPIVASLPAVLPENWDGTVPIANRYDFTRLDAGRVAWSWRRVAADGVETVTAAGEATLPTIAARDQGTLRLAVPANFADADYLALTLLGADGQAVWTETAWTRPPAGRAAAPTATPAAAPAWLGEPRVVAYRRENRDFVAVAPAGPARFTWTSLADGGVRLDYEFSYDGEADVLGIGFALPESAMLAKRWLGRGPYRVWQNRLEGTWLGVHASDFNDSTPGESFAYPELKGYFRDWRWLDLRTPAGVIRIENDSGVPYFGLGRPRDGVNGLLHLPDVGLAFLEVIPPMRDKFISAEKLGPQSQTRRVAGAHRGTLTFRRSPP